MSRKILKIITLIFLFIYTIGIFYFSSQSVPDYLHPEFEYMDKLQHIVGYFFYGLILSSFFIAHFRSLPDRKKVIWVAICGTLYGVSDEIHQYFVPGRQADIYDCLADMLGIILSLTFYKFIKDIIIRLSLESK